MTTIAKAATASISISDLNLTRACESAYEFEYTNGDGNGTGVFLSVLGSQSPTVLNFIRRRMQDRRNREALLAKRGKDIPPVSIEEDEEFGNEAAAIRVTGWRGITEPYTPALAMTLMESNSEMRAQVFKASNELANFTKG
jgi:hypothetical protein